MAKRYSTKYDGVFYRKSTTNGKPDKTYYISLKINGKNIEKKVGKHSEGVRIQFVHKKRLEALNTIREGKSNTLRISSSGKRQKMTFDDIATMFFESKSLHNKTNQQTSQRYKSQLKPLIGSLEISSISKNDILKIEIK